jgi:hypothetical protein
MIAVALIAFIFYAGILLALLVVPKKLYQEFFGMENLSDREYRSKRRNFGSAFVFFGGIVVEAMLLIAKS